MPFNPDQQIQAHKDMAQDYVSKVSKILDQIDEKKQKMILNPFESILLNERLHALFIKLSSKMTEGEINEQFDYEERLQAMKFYNLKRTKFSTEEISYSIDRTDYNIFKRLLEQREMHLNRIMERLGLTNVQKEITRRVT